MEFITLNNGVKIPMEGFGVHQIDDLSICEQAVSDALAAGYRLIDTASAYFNEEAVGAAIRTSGIPRDELFITTKLWVQDTNYESAKLAFQTSLKKLGLDYLDLYLVHLPYNDYYGAWRAMEELYEEGKIRALGVCNFYPSRLADLCMNVKVVPAINQVEINPFFQQNEAINNMKMFGVQPQAWGPLGQGKNGIFTNELLSAIANKYHKSIGQIVLRWNVQRGVIVIPKSINKNRIEENANIWDFSLNEEDMNEITKLDLGYSMTADPTSFEAAKAMNQWKIHE